jgi:hypothetical protein
MLVRPSERLRPSYHEAWAFFFRDRAGANE